MEDLIKQLALEPSRLAELTYHLTDFLEQDNNEANLRIGILAVLPRTGAGDIHWSRVDNDFKTVFPNIEKMVKNYNNENTFKRYIHGTHKPRDRSLKAYLTLYVLDKLIKRPDSLTRFQENNSNSLNMLESIKKYVVSNNVRILHDSTFSRTNLIEALAHVLQLPDDITRAHRFFFQKSSHFADRDEMNTIDMSYYAVYRYSTLRNEVVKSFLAIKPPKLNLAKCFSFTHVYQKSARNETRVSRGAIMSYDQCVHLIGWSSTNNATRLSGPGRPEGLKHLAIPTGGINAGSSLLSAVFLSHAMAWQPIVGRAALLHLGYKSELSKELTHKDVGGIGVISGQKGLISDIRKLCKMFKGLATDGRSQNDLKEAIELSINNRYYVDKDLPIEEHTLRALTIEDRRDPHD